MKRHRKLVALLVALTFIFSVAAPVTAAVPGDTEIAADKLNVLGIIKGYPDGSFGLEQNITRAEFAKIAVVAAGLTEAAGQMANFPSQFSDVKVGAWYTGWINMAASQGFVKGDPAGTFRPNDNITYAEVVTVLVRLLGYDDNLTGSWPTNYLSKAAELGITESIAFDAGAPAVRGDVFVMTSNTLDCYLVAWNTDQSEWKRITNEPKLIVNSFNSRMYEGLVTDIGWDVQGDLYLDVLYQDDEGVLRIDELKPVDNVTVTGADDAYGLLGRQVELIKNEKDSGADRNAIVYLGARETDSVADDEAKYTGRYIEVEGMKYDIADGFDVTYFPGDGDFDARDNVTLTGDRVEVVLNEDGEARWVFVYDFANPDIIEEIYDDRAIGYNHARIDYDEDLVQVFIKDGAMVGFQDLAEGDLVYVYEDNERTSHLLVFAVSEVMAGELEAATTSWSSLTIDGIGISTDSDCIVSNDGGASYNYGFNDDIFDEFVQYMLSPAGKIAAVIYDTAGDKRIGVIEKTDFENISGPKVRMLTPDGFRVLYTVDSDYYHEDRYYPGGEEKEVNESVWASIENRIGNGEYVLVEYTLDRDEHIKSVSVADTGTYEDYAENRARISEADGTGKWYPVSGNAAFFTVDDKNRLSDTDWDTFKAAGGNQVQIVRSNGVIQAMYIGQQIVHTDNLGVIVASGLDRNKDYYYDVFVDGEEVRYNLTESAAEATIVLGDHETEEGYDLDDGTVIQFDITGGMISGLSVATGHDYGLVTEDNGDSIQLDNDKYYYFDEDTMIVDITGSTGRIVSDVARGDYVVIYGEEDGIVDLVVITN